MAPAPAGPRKPVQFACLQALEQAEILRRLRHQGDQAARKMPSVQRKRLFSTSTGKNRNPDHQTADGAVPVVQRKRI